MCTLIALHRVIPGAPLIVAANRDEYLSRPSEPPALRTGPWGLALAPRDVRAGGSWLGFSATGVFAAVTNRPCPEPDPQRRSRGLLVFDALSAASAAQAAERLEGLPRRAYNPFNLFIADRRDAFLITYLDEPRRIDLDAGVHVVGNADPEAPTPRILRLRERAGRAAAEAPGSVPAALQALCREHGPADQPLAATCVHTPEYGTRSSTLLQLADLPTHDVMRFADGPPCRTGFEDFAPLLAALDGGVPRAPGDPAVRTAT
jgi:uncharacterized protein with NRDE domain